MSNSKLCYTNFKFLCNNNKCKVCNPRSFYLSESIYKKYWDNNKNDIDIKIIPKGTNKKYWFYCPKCNHSFQRPIKKIYITTEFISCCYCSRTSSLFCSKEDNCLSCYNKSFASCEKSNYINYDLTNLFYDILQTKIKQLLNNEINIDLDIKLHDNYTNSFQKILNKKFKDIYDKYYEEYNIKSFTNIFNKYNKNNNKKIKDIYNKYINKYNNINITKNSKQNFIIDPYKIAEKSNTILFWFDCKECNHHFVTDPLHIVKDNQFCPYCAGKKLCNDDECKFCFEKSFGNHPRSDFWDYDKNKNIKPYTLALSSHKKAHFICDKGHKFHKRIDEITCNGTWCPECPSNNKTEIKFKDWFKKNYTQYKLQYQPKYDWCKNPETNCYFPYDFSIKKLKLIIEIDGLQHFRQVSNWTPPEITFERDKYKIQQAFKKGYSIIRIFQEDIFDDKNDWEINFRNILHKYIKKIEPNMLCIGCEDLYTEYNELKITKNTNFKFNNNIEHTWCDTCNKNLQSKNYNSHIKTNRHIKLTEILIQI